MSAADGIRMAGRVESLTISVAATRRTVLDDVSLEVPAGRIIGLAGETGSGKSTLGLSMLGFTAPGLVVDAGSVTVDGADLLAPAIRRSDRIRDLRGRVVASVPQDPASALNPGLRLREAVGEVLAAHGVADAAERRRRTSELFAAVGLPADPAFADRYPHQVSGGQLQRVAIAIAFSLDPALVVMDEPTTGLDVSTTARIADLVKELSRARGAGVVFISHDLRLLLGLADRVAVMQGGRIVEEGTPEQLLGGAEHPYTRRLLAALPEPHMGETVATASPAHPVVEVREMSARHGATTITRGISFELRPGGCLAVVGESGSGKTTTARAIAGLHPDFAGEVLLHGEVLEHQVIRRSTAERRSVQYVFQNPYGSLNPRHTIGRSIADARRLLTGVSRRQAGLDAVAIIEQVGLRADHLLALPHQLSGGQRQRAALARALAGEPEVLVCDEVTSSLDLSVQAEVVALLQRLQRERGLALLFITHDLALAAEVADEAIVLLRGEIVECGPTAQVLSEPRHEYTRQLVEAARSVVSPPTQ